MRPPHPTSHSELDQEHDRRARDKEERSLEPDVSELRRIRIERLEHAAPPRTSSDASAKMPSESQATLSSAKSSSRHSRRKEQHRSPEEEERRRRRRKSTARDDVTYVYGTSREDTSQPSRVTVSETRRLGRDGESSESEDEDIQSDHASAKPRKSKTRVVYVTKGDGRPAIVKERRSRDDTEAVRPRRTGESVRKSRARPSRRESVVGPTPVSPPRRSASTKDLPAEDRSNLKRHNTTSTHVSTSKQASAPSSASANTTNKRASFLGTFFGPVPQQHREPERLVECLTCLSDDIPRSKSAKLKCGHRMCHSCLRRIFKLSITDPQHMPPKCCTADHIPLKHVDKLFDVNFKKTWNRKFQEYSTKNRIYCPARRCGEWIKPGNIHKEDGRKYGKCSRCKTKVCCICNGKWHGNKDCPKDEETNRLLETAKQAGWQRCYNCRAMVELKEGCNHMTCRCTAEFCMICGLKWKSCNCPWFNYETVEQDRLNHMRIANQEAQGQRLYRIRRARPNNYNDEVIQRRRQERADEELARRLQMITVEEDADDDYQGGIGDIHGIGNGADHFMNQNYVRAAHNILTGHIDQATAAANYVMGVAQARGGPAPIDHRRMADRFPIVPPVLRRHTMREHAYNSAASTRPSERVVPRRERNDYESEAAVHAPLRRVHQRSASTTGEPRPSILAGLGGAGRGSNRVSAWRSHVEPGVEPAEGVLSM